MLQVNFEAFAKLSQQDRALIEEGAGKTVRAAAARRDLVREGDPPCGMILILEGWACCYKQLPDGRRQITSFLVPGDLGDANVFVLDRMDYSIGAITNVRYAEIGRADFERMLAESPRLTQALWRHELATSAINREWIVNVGQRSARERIAHLLCELLAKLRAAGLSDGAGCDFPLTQTDLADATGLTSVHVNRTLQELRRDGLIDLHGRRLIVPDPRALERVASFNPLYLHLNAEAQASR